MKTTWLFALALLAAPAFAEAWRCRNPDLEVACADGACRATPAGEFTPMDVAFDETGSISACLYSGCWEGRADASGDDRYLVLLLREAVFSPRIDDEPRRGELALVFDRDAGVATLMTGGFVQPLACTPALSPSAP